MGYRIPETTYDSGVNAFWMNANDRVSYQRAFDEGNVQDQKMSQALLTANPQTANIEIQVNMNRPQIPPREGYDPEPLNIEQVLGNELYKEGSRTNTRVWNDFSDVNSEINSTSLPSITPW